MSKDKPSLPKGTRDFGPETMLKRNFIIQNIRNVFELFGFLPLETPSMENLSVLTGKYGDEGDQLLFKILNSGDFFKDVQESDIQQGSKKILPKIAEKGLRYDLTVPFARFVAMNRNEIEFPFKRYQIQPVWRADRPQKGRYREFYQCDADVVGTDSLICEMEIVAMINSVFQKLGLNDFTIKVNNRKVLAGIAEYIGTPGQEAGLSVAIDKLDKIGEEKVYIELLERGFAENNIEKLKPLLKINGNNQEKITALKSLFSNSETGLKGLQEIEEIFKLTTLYNLYEPHIEVDFMLARGLSYYTGTIFEVKANNVVMGSISGGGRYDNLTGSFGLPGVSGVGISFGIDRIYDVMEELKLFPEANQDSTQVLFVNFDKESEGYVLPIISELRSAGIKSELFPESGKLKKQMNYANNRKIRKVVLAGSEEIKNSTLTLKDMTSGEQKTISKNELLKWL
jgi:histidyl-tRNA synthetase